MKLNELGLAMGNTAGYILTAIQTNEVFQVIELVLAVLTSIILLLYRIWSWWKKAKEDGKITKEEISEGLEILGDGIKDVKDKIDKKEEK